MRLWASERGGLELSLCLSHTDVIKGQTHEGFPTFKTNKEAIKDRVQYALDYAIRN